MDSDIQWSNIVDIIQMEFDIPINIVYCFMTYIIKGPSYYDNFLDDIDSFGNINIDNIKVLHNYIYYKFNDHM